MQLSEKLLDLTTEVKAIEMALEREVERSQRLEQDVSMHMNATHYLNKRIDELRAENDRLKLEMLEERASYEAEQPRRTTP